MSPPSLGRPGANRPSHSCQNDVFGDPGATAILTYLLGLRISKAGGHLIARSDGRSLRTQTVLFAV
jgi:hypothetical protein